MVYILFFSHDPSRILLGVTRSEHRKYRDNVGNKNSHPPWTRNKDWLFCVFYPVYSEGTGPCILIWKVEHSLIEMMDEFNV